MENTGFSIKRKIIATAVSILLCILVIGISVYAALAQSMTLTNQIIISTSGQTKVEAKIYEYINTGSDAITELTGLASEPSWGSEKYTKDANNDSFSGTLSDAVFDAATGKNYYAWKIEFTNTDTKADAYAHISSPAVDNSQIDVYAGTDWSALEKKQNTAVAGEVPLTASNGTGVYYIVVVTNENLSDLNSASPIDFGITINIDQIAA